MSAKKQHRGDHRGAARPARSGAASAPATAVAPTAVPLPVLTNADHLAAECSASAATARSLGLVDEAAGVLDAAAGLGATNPGILRDLAAEYCYLGRFGRAIDVLTAAIDRDQLVPMPLYGDLVRMLLVAGRPSEAEQMARRGIAAHGESGELLCGIGAALRHRGDSEAAVAALHRAAAVPAPLPVAYGELALAEMSLGHYDGAVKAQVRAQYLAGQPMHARHIAAYRTSTVKAWTEANGARYDIVIPSGTGRAFRPSYAETPAPPAAEPVLQPEVYLAEIPGASIIGGQGIILAGDNTALLDIAFWPRAERLDLAEPSVPYIDARAALIDAAAVEPVPIPAGVMFHGFGVRNYYHWLAEFLPRLLVLEKCGVPADIPLLVDKRTYGVAQLAEALRIADRSGRPVVQLEPDTEYKVDRLIVPSSLAWLIPNLRDHLHVEFGDSVMAAEAVEFVRERLGAPGRDRPGTRRLYIARRASTSPTRLANEAAVRAVFEAAGFEILHPDRLTFAEQREVFAGAAMIASESGAGLANMLLAPASATMICLVAEEYPMSVYADLTGHAGQSALFVAGEITGEVPVKPYHARFTVAPERLGRILAGL